MALADEIEEEPLVEQGEPASFDEVLDYYGSTAAIAEAAGYGTAAAPMAGGGKGSPRAQREAFMRRLRRYRDGTRDWRWDPASRALVEGMVREVRSKSAVEQLADLMLTEGLTVTGEATIGISQDEREQDWPDPGRFISPRIARLYDLDDLVRRRAWDELEVAFSDALSTAYLGGPGLTLIEVDELTLQLGRVPGARAERT